MTMKESIKFINQHLARLAEWVTYVLTVITAVGLISSFFEWGRQGPLSLLVDNFQVLLLSTLSLATIVLWIWIIRLHRRFVLGFSENFKGNLGDNWDFIGPWRIVDNGTLVVTGSDAGGITKVGAFWENYTLAFKARIINECLGVIVRAQDLQNYYMFQIRPDKVRPHRRAAVPVIMEKKRRSKSTASALPLRGPHGPGSFEREPEPEDNILEPVPISYFIGWQAEENSPEFISVPISPKLENWFDCRVTVRGQTISISINDSLVFQRDSFLHIPTGKVGFRNFGSEEAFVKDVSVTLHS